MDSSGGVRGSPQLADLPGNCEFHLFCFHKTHLTRWTPIFLRKGKPKLGKGLHVGVRVGRKRRGGGKRKDDSGWNVPENLLCASPDPLLFYPINSLDLHGSSMKLCSSSLCQQRNGVISLLVTEPGEKKQDWNPNPGRLTP